MSQQFPLPYEVEKRVKQLGENIRIARIRRRQTQQELASSCDIARTTLQRIENGAPGIAVGTLLMVLWRLALLSTVEAVANPDTDEHGKVREMARLGQRVRQGALDNDF